MEITNVLLSLLILLFGFHLLITLCVVDELKDHRKAIRGLKERLTEHTKTLVDIYSGIDEKCAEMADRQRQTHTEVMQIENTLNRINVRGRHAKKK